MEPLVQDFVLEGKRPRRALRITQHCDRRRLPIRARLELFIEVCDAVQHAHQKGIIHRDLKPSNILVTTRDGRDVPKVIDFGVAKALHQKLTERTLHTGHGQLVGTPEYMSPEQAEMTAQGIDTSVRVSMSRPVISACSGLMYSGVPTI